MRSSCFPKTLAVVALAVVVASSCSARPTSSRPAQSKSLSRECPYRLGVNHGTAPVHVRTKAPRGIPPLVVTGAGEIWIVQHGIANRWGSASASDCGYIRAAYAPDGALVAMRLLGTKLQIERITRPGAATVLLTLDAALPLLDFDRQSVLASGVRDGYAKGMGVTRAGIVLIRRTSSLDPSCRPGCQRKRHLRWTVTLRRWTSLIAETTIGTLIDSVSGADETPDRVVDLASDSPGGAYTTAQLFAEGFRPLARYWIIDPERARIAEVRVPDGWVGSAQAEADGSSVLLTRSCRGSSPAGCPSGMKSLLVRRDLSGRERLVYQSATHTVENAVGDDNAIACDFASGGYHAGVIVGGAVYPLNLRDATGFSYAWLASPPKTVASGVMR